MTGKRGVGLERFLEPGDRHLDILPALGIHPLAQVFEGGDRLPKALLFGFEELRPAFETETRR